MYQVDENGSTVVTSIPLEQLVSIKIKNTENIFLGVRIGANFEVPGLGISMMVIDLQKFANNCFILDILPEIACCMVLHRLRHQCHKLLRELR